MKFHNIFLVLLSLQSTLIMAQTSSTAKKAALDAAEGCTSDSYEIIEQEDPIMVGAWMRGYLKGNFISKFGTTVHECLHGYDSELGNTIDWDDDTYPIAFFIEHNRVVKFPGKKLFETSELHKDYFPQDVKNLFRYSAYVMSNSGPAEVTANLWGIYGLLEEFNAYGHDLRAQIEYFECVAGKNNVTTFSNVICAYYEFNIFMAYYLNYAKENHQEDYEYMMNNESLRTAYTLIETKWRNLLTHIMSDQSLAKRFPEFKTEFSLFDDELRAVMNHFMLPKSQLSQHKDFFDRMSYDESVISEHLDWPEQMNLTGFGAGMSVEELEEEYGNMEDKEIDFDLKDSNYYYVTILTTKSQEELMEVMVEQMFKFKNLGVYFTEDLNFTIYLDKFKNPDKASKFLHEVKAEFNDAKIQ